MNGPVYTHAEIFQIITYWKLGLRYPAIAKKIGRLSHSVAPLHRRLMAGEGRFNTAKGQRKPRQCLLCQRTFKSWGAGNRICKRCRNRKIWGSGQDLEFDVATPETEVVI